jgi:predicted transcriptional regulator
MLRREYDALRAFTLEMVAEYDVAQRVLARAVGVRQPFISSVLKGKQVSLPTLEGIVRAITTSLRQADRDRLHQQLTRVRSLAS